MRCRNMAFVHFSPSRFKIIPKLFLCKCAAHDQRLISEQRKSLESKAWRLSLQCSWLYPRLFGKSAHARPSIYWSSEVGSSVPHVLPWLWSLLPLPAQLLLEAMVHQEFALSSVRLSVRLFCNTAPANSLNFLRNWILWCRGWNLSEKG